MKIIKSFESFESNIQDESNASAIAEVDIFIDQINTLRENFENTFYIKHDDDLVNGWYIKGHDKEGDVEEEISEEDIEKIKKYI